MGGAFAALVIALLGVKLVHERVEARCAQEGEDAVVVYLRSGASGKLAEVGDFVGLEGGGWYPPVWNIQGYNYLTLERTATFAKRSVPVKIYVTEGRRAAPGQTAVGHPYIEKAPNEWRIFVSHPDLPD